MDHSMHDLWLRAENQIDAALAGLAACAGWFIACIVTVILTPLEWSSGTIVLALIPFPLATVCVRPLVTGIEVAHAIEQRDADELARWRETGVPLRYPELLRARLVRAHYPLLIVVAVTGAYIVALGIYRAVTAHFWAEATYSSGFILIGIGAISAAAVLTRVEHAYPQTTVARLVAVTWLLPVGVGAIAWAMIAGGSNISTGTENTYSAIVFVLFGVLLGLVAIGLAVLWIGWLGRAVSGRGLHRHRRVTPEEQEELDRFAEQKDAHTGNTGEIPVEAVQLNTAEWSLQLVGLSPEETEANGVPEFDANDVEIIRRALRKRPADFLAPIAVVLLSLVIVALTLAGLGGSLIHGAVAAVLVVAMAVVLAQARTVRG